MDSRKRKAPLDLYRRVKVRKDAPASDDEWDGVSNPENGSEAEGLEESGEGEEEGNDGDKGDADDRQSESGQSGDDDASEGSEVDASSISFGALAKAQATVPRPAKRKPGASSASSNGRRRHRGGDDEDEDEDDSSSSAGSGDELARTGRESGGRGAAEPKGKPNPAAAAAPRQKKKSKHAPEETSSKRRVSRYREVVTRPPNARPKPRDPRFMPEVGAAGAAESDPAAAARLRRNYAFLDEYRDAELRQMKERLAASNRAASAALQGRKRKRGDKAAPQLSPQEREELKRAIMAMENQKRARERKDKEEELLAEHRRKEKELVRQGKKPFYLKRSEQKKMLLMDQYAGMSKGQVDKAIERKRKKVAGKEKKQLPFARRGAGES